MHCKEVHVQFETSWRIIFSCVKLCLQPIWFQEIKKSPFQAFKMASGSASSKPKITFVGPHVSWQSTYLAVSLSMYIRLLKLIAWLSLVYAEQAVRVRSAPPPPPPDLSIRMQATTKAAATKDPWQHIFCTWLSYNVIACFYSVSDVCSIAALRLLNLCLEPWWHKERNRDLPEAFRFNYGDKSLPRPKKKSETRLKFACDLPL